jgi:hypothetical protein
MSKESPVQEPFAWENNASVVDEAGKRNKKKKRKKSLAGSLSLCLGLGGRRSGRDMLRRHAVDELERNGNKEGTSADRGLRHLEERERERREGSGVRSICREDALLCGSEAFGTHQQENTSLFPPNPTIRRSYLQSSPAILKHPEREEHLQAPIIISPAPIRPNCCSSRVMRGGDSSLRCCSIPLGNGGSCRNDDSGGSYVVGIL